MRKKKDNEIINIKDKEIEMDKYKKEIIKEK